MVRVDLLTICLVGSEFIINLMDKYLDSINYNNSLQVNRDVFIYIFLVIVVILITGIELILGIVRLKQYIGV